MERPSFFTSLTRSQLASFAASAVDFVTLIALVELAGVWYVFSTVCGATAGAVTSFLLGRHWSFVATDGHLSGQAVRYAAVSGMSLLLNTTGVYLLTDHLGIKYAASRVIAGAVVGIFFNFPLHRRFVFKIG